MTFDDAFREIGRRSLPGGGKTMGADEIAFRGRPFGRWLSAVSRVRLRDPRESYMTNAAHRIRDSKVGGAGYWVDLRVAGDVTDDELAEIRALAQAEDARPVRVRRA
jgi:hypothetical protein